MSAPDFSLGQGDTGVVWQQPIFDRDGNQLDPTGGTVVLHYRIFDASVPAVEAPGSIIPVAGFPANIAFTFAPAPAPAVYWAVWVVTLASGEVVTWPAIRGRARQVFEVEAKP